MKKYLMLVALIFMISFFMAGDIWAQKQDSTKVKQQPASIEKIDSLDSKIKADSANAASEGKPLKGFIDKNANGIDDRIENAGSKGKQQGKKDRFIDRNGDGICDGRESALGIKKAFRNRKGGKKF